MLPKEKKDEIPEMQSSPSNYIYIQGVSRRLSQRRYGTVAEGNTIGKSGDVRNFSRSRSAAPNSVTGLHSHTGHWVTYNTPMDGVRRASAHDIVFQAREDSPELNCCSVNGPRGLGIVSTWVLMRCRGGLILNRYGSSTMKAQLSSEVTIELVQKTEYPRTGKIAINVSPSRPTQLVLKLRIPYWSSKTRIKLNGERVKSVPPATYLVMDREWKVGDKIELELDMSLHDWIGEKECEGKASIYRGPILLTYDRRLNTMGRDKIPTLNATAMKERLIDNKDNLPTVVLIEYTAPDGRKLWLCDFGSAGESGSPYRSWLPVEQIKKTHFASDNPLRSGRS